MIGGMLESFAFLIAVMIVLSKLPPLDKRMTEQHVHDLGNLMFAFIMNSRGCKRLTPGRMGADFADILMLDATAFRRNNFGRIGCRRWGTIRPPRPSNFHRDRSWTRRCESKPTVELLSLATQFARPLPIGRKLTRVASDSG